MYVWHSLTMKKFSFLTIFVLCVFVSVSSFAQESLPLRAAERDGYTRLTFGWEDSVNYTMQRNQKNDVIIIFDRSSNLDPSSIDFTTLPNVSAVQVLSTEPLKVSLSIPKSSDVRDFKIGRRVILDVYHPHEVSETSEVSVSKVEKKSSQEEPPLKTVQEKTAQVKIEETKKPKALVDESLGEKESTKKKEMPAVPPAIVLVPENVPEAQRGWTDNIDPVKAKKPEDPKEKQKEKEKKAAIEKQKQKLQDAVEDGKHVVSIRSTKSLNMAVFEDFGSMWIVYNDDTSYVIPSFSSARPELFSDPQPFPSENARVYRIDLPDIEMGIQGKGGGLVWDIIMGENLKDGAPVKPIREIKSAENKKIIWPLKFVGEIIDLSDPFTGQNLKIIMVEDDAQFAGGPMSYVDFDLLRSPVGLVLRPKVDDLIVEKTERGVEVYRPSGLALTPGRELSQALIFAEQKAKESLENNGGNAAEEKKNFFLFDEWQPGDAKQLDHNENLLLSSLYDKSEGRRIEDLMTLGKMFLSHGRGAEALGYFNFAVEELPGLKESPEFRALRGVAKALDWKSDAALEDFLFPALHDQEEVNYWKSYALADLGDWQQAAAVLPNTYKPIHDYPANIASRLALVLAEVALRDGRLDAADELLFIVEKNSSEIIKPMAAYHKYLQGEAYRQKNQKDKTEKMWTELSQDQDDRFRTKSALALTILFVNDNKINNKEAIDRLERLRYAWRGDELEAQVNYWLGVSYFKEKNFLKGLSIMRDAASFAGDTALGTRITTHMGKTFTDLFLGKDLENVTPVDAVALYEEFSELTPVGQDGDKLVQNLAERLVSADLLNRAANLLRHQVDHRLEGKEKLQTAIRLAVIELFDRNPQKAMDALSDAQDTLQFLAETKEKEDYKREIQLLKIQAFSQNQEYDHALALLENMTADREVNRLRADVAWQAGYWDEAAAALLAVMTDENISLTRPPSDIEVNLVLRRAIALNLSNDRVALSNIRSKYKDLMLQTPKAHQFEVITRPRGTTNLADRDTLLSIVSEVDMFKDFLDSYREATSN